MQPYKIIYFIVRPVTAGMGVLLSLMAYIFATKPATQVRLRQTRKTIPFGFFIASLLFGTSSIVYAASIDFDALDKRFQKFSQDFYKQTVNNASLPLDKFKSLTALKNKVDEYINAGKPVHAIALIHHNNSTMRNNIDSPDIISLIALLLENDDWNEAKQLFDVIKYEAGKSAASNVSFEFAKYFMKRKQWQKAWDHLNDVINELSVENAHYAQIMIGTILQHQKKHREAVTYYKKVKPSSKYYATAVLNTAVAYIRQDWWTDALLLINETVEKKNKHVSDEMADRLNLLLGYALLRKEYFRNSRDTFRKVRLNSPYTNKALLGIALTAANQDDFIGALNAITILKDKRTTDLSVDESYLLLPYTYGKLKQHLTASSAYAGAIAYYQERISSLEEIINARGNVLSLVKISNTNKTIQVKSNSLDYSRRYPNSFFDNYANLAHFKTRLEGANKLNKQYSSLVADYNTTLKAITMNLVTQRIDYLQSYLNQSRYGLARLYDSSLISAN